MVSRYLIVVPLTIGTLFSLDSCVSKGEGNETEQSVFVASSEGLPHFDLPDIQQNGELIALSTYGASTFFEFRGENFGLQYMIAREYAKSIGVSIRVERCRNEEELIRRLQDGEGDLVISAIQCPDSIKEDALSCGEKAICQFLDSMSVQRNDKMLSSKGNKLAWLTRSDAPILAESLNGWMDEHAADFYDYVTIKIRTTRGKEYTPRRRVSAPILNMAKGQISVHDNIFKRYATTCGWDWRLIAAQAYQESAFDPEAVSFMGAMGLMQLMPSTAKSVGVSQDRVFDAETNVKGAVRLINQLNSHYASITNKDERINFILAAYNAGPGHVDDARALAKKYGKNPDVWLGNVDSYVLNMSKAEYFNQPEVAHGYFRGSETYDYVNSIRSRWTMYRTKIK